MSIVSSARVQYWLAPSMHGNVKFNEISLKSMRESLSFAAQNDPRVCTQAWKLAVVRLPEATTEVTESSKVACLANCLDQVTQRVNQTVIQFYQRRMDFELIHEIEME